MLPSGIQLYILVARVFLGLRWGAQRATLLLFVLGTVLIVEGWWPRLAPEPDDGRPKQIVLIGIDGLRLKALGRGNTPVMDYLIDDGVSTLVSDAVLPTMSSPNWASHLMGVGPELHGITENAWRRREWEDLSFCGRETGAGWPTIFDLVAEQRPGARTALVHHWVGIARFVPRRVVDRRRFRPRAWLAIRSALHQIVRRESYFTFVHFDHVDKAGHAYGFDTWQYHRAVSEADAYIGRILDGLEEAGRLDDTLIMVISDHGGIGRNHGGATREEVEVPWIMWGRSVTEPRVLAGDFSVTQTAPTLAYAMGLFRPDCWTADPVTQAFEAQPG